MMLSIETEEDEIVQMPEALDTEAGKSLIGEPNSGDDWTSNDARALLACIGKFVSTTLQ